MKPAFEKSIIVEAVQKFPKPVLREFLRFRKKAADVHAPGWQTECPEKQLERLDNATILNASRN